MTRNTIYINGRFLTQPVTGVQRYSLELIRHMDLLLGEGSVHQDIELICLVPPGGFKQPEWKNIETRKVGWNRGNIWEQVDLPLHAGGRLLFSPANLGPYHYHNQVVTLHDASTFAIPQAYSSLFRLKYAFISKQLGRHARLLITDSEFSRQQLSFYLGIRPERLTSIPLGAEHLEKIQPDTRILEQHHLEKGCYLLTVASQSLHKNFPKVLEALSFLKSDFPVVAAGGSFKQIFQRGHRPPFPANFHFTGYISDEALKALYENARGFIFPSVYEGFGLPILEAMHCGCPVLSSNSACLPEVGGDAALYFDPHQTESLANAISTFLSSTKLQDELRSKGYERAARFRWPITAQRTLEKLIDYSGRSISKDGEKSPPNQIKA